MDGGSAGFSEDLSRGAINRSIQLIYLDLTGVSYQLPQLMLVIATEQRLTSF